MISESEIINRLKERSYYPQKVRELAIHFEVDESDYDEFAELITQLEQSHKLYRSKQNRILLPESAGIFQGILKKSDKGYGFVDIKEPVEKSYFIAPDKMNNAEDQDVVLVRELDNEIAANARREGIILTIIERGITNIVGTIENFEDGVWRIIADDPKLGSKLILMEATKETFVKGHKVLAKVKAVVNDSKMHVSFIRLLGHENDPGMDILSLVAQSGVPYHFSEKVLENAQVRAELPIEANDSRKDYRELFTVTIDGEDAKDLDDAISFKTLQNGNYKLGVHIADVSYYVNEGSEIDVEAFKRGTSIYLADRVIPMLPHILSNGVCSLNPQTDRYTMSCIMEVDEKGAVVNYEINPGIIHSNERMTYEEVNNIFENKLENLSESKREVSAFFHEMHTLSKILQNRRQVRGAIDFEIPEAKIIVDAQGKVVDVAVRSRKDAERLIEEFMLLANETVAAHLFFAEMPSLYRVHEEPKVSKLQTFATLAQTLGFPIKGNLANIHPKSLQTILQQIKGSEAESVISTMLLRSLQKARYSEEALGHFGLSTKYYTHFTSPIRRYPDLVIHRLLRSYFSEGKISDNKFIESCKEAMPTIAHDTSVAEQKAVDLERKTTSMKEAEYMQSHVGERFKGTVSSVTGFGIFVTLPNLIEGLVHMSELRDDHYVFIEKNMSLAGQKTGKKYKLGDKVEVIVAQASKKDAKIDFFIITDKMQDSTISFLQRKAKSGGFGESRKPAKPRFNRFDKKSGSNNFRKERTERNETSGTYKRKRTLSSRNLRG